MIIANVIGGLGNQMFQYACGRALAADLGHEFRISSDMFDGYALHQGLMLDQVFSLQLRLATPAQMQKLLGPLRSVPIVRRALAMRQLAWLRGSRFLAEPEPGYWAALRAQSNRGAYLHGYWQSERYFSHRSDMIRADFAWRHPLEGRNAALAREISAGHSTISIHVRRGDYVTSAKNQSIYASCTPKYYAAALARLSSLAPKSHVYAFSDDPAWVSRVIAPLCPELTLIDHNRGAKSAIDMRLMSLCRHHIIANSSFSWWGAWLDSRPDKRVIAPAQWFRGQTVTPDLLPADWETIEI